MHVHSISVPLSSSLTTVAQVKEQLEALAKQHRVTVDELVSGAKAAGVDGSPYQVRALNLQARLDRLEK